MDQDTTDILAKLGPGEVTTTPGPKQESYEGFTLSDGRTHCFSGLGKTEDGTAFTVSSNRTAMDRSTIINLKPNSLLRTESAQAIDNSLFRTDIQVTEISLVGESPQKVKVMVASETFYGAHNDFSGVPPSDGNTVQLVTAENPPVTPFAKREACIYKVFGEPQQLTKEQVAQVKEAWQLTVTAARENATIGRDADVKDPFPDGVVALLLKPNDNVDAY